MANKRTLKRSIRLICEELFTEAVAASLYGNGKNQGNAEAVIFSVIRLQNDYLSRVSHPEPGLAPADYYKHLRTHFSAEAADLADQINNL